MNGELRKAQAAAATGAATPLEVNDAERQLHELRDLLHLGRREKDIAEARVRFIFFLLFVHLFIYNLLSFFCRRTHLVKNRFA